MRNACGTMRLLCSYDTASLNAGGAFARLDLNAEACKSLIAQAMAAHPKQLQPKEADGA
jgi:hypothetical protein